MSSQIIDFQPTPLPRARPLELGPPTIIQEAVGYAADRVDELAAADRELHFVKDELTGRMVVQVRDLQGNVIEEITGSRALDVMAGLEDV